MRNLSIQRSSYPVQHFEVQLTTDSFCSGLQNTSIPHRFPTEPVNLYVARKPLYMKQKGGSASLFGTSAFCTPAGALTLDTLIRSLVSGTRLYAKEHNTASGHAVCNVRACGAEKLLRPVQLRLFQELRDDGNVCRDHRVAGV